MSLWVNRLSGELRSCGTMASTTHRTAPYLFNARNSQDATELLPHSTKSKTVLEREDRITSNKHSVISFFTILQKMCIVLFLSFSDVNCFVALAHSRCMLLSCIFDWDCWSVLDNLWRRFRGSVHFKTTYRLLFSWRNAAP